MNATKEKISKVFMDGRVFYIPFYQRAYVWTDKLWERFRDDMEYISSHDEEYFFGSIILKDLGEKGIETDRQEVVDGQQRITTMAVYIKVLSLRDPNIHLFDKKFRLDDNSLTIRHSQLDRDAFELIADLTEDVPLDGESNLIKAYNYFRANIDTEKIDINKILARAVFITINLDNGENEHKIFDTINSLGVNLTTGELLKNHLFNESTFDKYNSIWKPAFEENQDCLNFWSGDYTVGRIKTVVQEGFFYTLLQVIMHDPKNNITSDQKKEFRKFDSLFENFKKLMTFGHWDKIDFAREIVEYAKIYRSIFRPQILKESDSTSTQLKRIMLMVFALDASTVLPYVLYILRNVPDEKEQTRVFEYLESYIVRRQICHSKNGNYSDLFTENLIGQQTKTYDSLKHYIDTRESSVSMPSAVDVRNYIKDYNGLSSTKARAILYLLESKLRDTKLSTSLLSFEKYSLEHLMPQNWYTYWMPADVDDDSKNDFIEERDNIINTLGNLAIITQPLNASIRDSAWSKKKNGFSGHPGLVECASSLVTLKDVLTKMEWNESTIEERAGWLADKVESIWPE